MRLVLLGLATALVAGTAGAAAAQSSDRYDRYDRDRHRRDHVRSHSYGDLGRSLLHGILEAVVDPHHVRRHHARHHRASRHHHRHRHAERRHRHAERRHHRAQRRHHARRIGPPRRLHRTHPGRRHFGFRNTHRLGYEIVHARSLGFDHLAAILGYGVLEYLLYEQLGLHHGYGRHVTGRWHDARHHRPHGTAYYSVGYRSPAYHDALALQLYYQGERIAELTDFDRDGAVDLLLRRR